MHIIYLVMHKQVHINIYNILIPYKMVLHVQYLWATSNITFHDPGCSWRGHPPSKVIAYPEPMLFERSRQSAVEWVLGTEPLYSVSSLTWYQPNKYCDIKHDTFSQFVVLCRENIVRTRNSVTWHVSTKDLGYFAKVGQSSVKRTKIYQVLDRSTVIALN